MRTIAIIVCVALLAGCARDWEREMAMQPRTPPADSRLTPGAPNAAPDPAPAVRVHRQGDVAELDIDSLVGNQVLVDGHRRYFNGYSRYPNGVLRWLVVTDKHDATSSLAPEAVSELCEPQSNQRFEYNPVTRGFTDPASASAARQQVRAEEEALRAKAEEERRRRERIDEYNSDGERAARAEAERARREAFQQRIAGRSDAYVAFDTPTDDAAVGSAVFKVIAAAGTEAIRRQSNDQQGLEAAIVGQLAGMGRDALVQSAVTDAFPNLSEHQASIIASVVGLMFEGKLTKLNLAGEIGKQEVIRLLDQEDPALGGSAKVVDFLVSIGLKLQDQGG